KGTDFQLKIGQLLQEIPYGSTLSYRELAQRFGNVKAIRAIAHANAQNPLWIVVPCHRIIGLNGDLTGYAGGIWRKKYLLELENKSYQTKLF
ncbi:MAG: cysteine methyltransferase, partial [Flavobacteriales bacterium CG_4_9_14_0_2_um_filter_35_242]